MIAVAGAAVVAHVVGILVFSYDGWLSRLVSNVFWLLGALVCFLKYCQLARRAPTRAEKTAWLLLSLGLLSWFIAMIWWSWRELVDKVYAPVDELPSLGFSILPAFFALGLPRFRKQDGDQLDRKERVADIAAVSAIIALIWLGLVSQVADDFEDLTRLAPVLARALLYSLALVVGILVFSRPIHLDARTAWLLLAGLATLVGTYFAFVATILVQRYESGQLFDALWTVAFALMYLAGTEHQLAAKTKVRAQTWLSSPMIFLWGLVLASLAVGLVIYHEVLRLLPYASLSLALLLAITLALRVDVMLEKERRARGEVAAALKKREDFLVVASHELRTPLTPLLLRLSLLTHELGENAADAVKGKTFARSLRGLERSVERLGKLVDHLLDVSRIDHGTLVLPPEDVDLVELVHEVVEPFRSQLPSGTELVVHSEGAVRGRWDPFAIERAFSELLANAIKFGAGKKIEVRVSREHATAKLVVHDEGIGIARADQQRIFDRLERAVPFQRYGGWGLGLFIARQIVEAHSGAISVASEPGKGATFTIELPILPEP